MGPQHRSPGFGRERPLASPGGTAAPERRILSGCVSATTPSVSSTCVGLIDRLLQRRTGQFRSGPGTVDILRGYAGAVCWSTGFGPARLFSGRRNPVLMQLPEITA